MKKVKHQTKNTYLKIVLQTRLLYEIILTSCLPSFIKTIHSKISSALLAYQQSGMQAHAVTSHSSSSRNECYFLCIVHCSSKHWKGKYEVLSNPLNINLPQNSLLLSRCSWVQQSVCVLVHLWISNANIHIQNEYMS